MGTDLTAAAAELAAGRGRAVERIEASIAAAGSPACKHVFVRTFFDEARAAARAADTADRRLPLAGLAVSVKDLFDVRGAPTTAASKSMAGASPAARDCTAVARLRAAGAALIGHTNLTEFAYSGVGINPHHGTPVNPATRALDATPRIPGGSTSGGAVSVAAGAAWAALGSDTGGSIRIPAALQGLVGFKNTQALTPLDGCLPLSPSFDTACAITLSVRDAVLVHEVLSARRVTLAAKPARALRLALPAGVLLDSLDTTVARAFERSLRRLRDAGTTIVETNIDGLDTAATARTLSGILASEAWQFHRSRLATQAADYDPRVATRIRLGERLSAADVEALHEQRRSWRSGVERSLHGFDAVLCPTLPIVAPALAPLIADDDAFAAANVLLLRNPRIINQLDGCAISLPCHTSDELPVGLMLWSTALRDDALLDAALQVEAVLAAERDR